MKKRWIALLLAAVLPIGVLAGCGSEALRRGDLRVLAAGNGRIAFSRAFGDERLVVCVNHSIGEWVLPAGRVRFAESAAPSPTGEVVLMRGGFCLLEPSDPEAHISIE